MGQKINLIIGNKNYSVVAETPEIESHMRKASELINKQFNTYTTNFPDTQKEDKFAFIALNSMVSLLIAQKEIEKHNIEEDRLHTQLEDYLNK